MPSSKKKSKGSKGRKTAAKAGKQLVNEEATTNMEEQKGSLDSKMKGLPIDKDGAEDDFLEEAIKLAAAEKRELEAETEQKEAERLIEERENCCKHGYNPSPSEHDICKKFMNFFMASFRSTAKRGGSLCSIVECLVEVDKKMTKKFSDIWKDPIRRKLFISYCLGGGTEAALDGSDDGRLTARTCAVVAFYFEKKIARFETTLPIGAKMVELNYADDHTLVQFFRKRIPCSCLDEKYKEVRHIAKVGICWNPQCKLGPDRMRVKRSGMVYCVQCRVMNYCSRECQVDHWPDHKLLCGETVDFLIFEPKKKA